MTRAHDEKAGEPDELLGVGCLSAVRRSGSATRLVGDRHGQLSESAMPITRTMSGRSTSIVRRTMSESTKR